MTITGILIRRTFMIIILSAVLFTACVVKVLFFMPYEASAVIMVDIKKSPTTVETRDVNIHQMISMIRIHSHLLKSMHVVKSVVEEMGLYEEVPDEIYAGGFNKKVVLSKEEKIRAMADILSRRHISVDSPVFTNLVEVKVKHKDPHRAAEIANLLVKKYINWSIDFLHCEVDDVIEYLDGEILHAKDKLEGSESALKEFKEAHDIVHLPEEMSAFIKRQIMFETDYSHADVHEKEELKRLESLREKARLKIMNDELDTLSYDPSMLALSATNNPIIQDFEKELLDLEIELSRLRELYTDESVQVRYMKKRISDLKEKINTAIKKIFTSRISISSLNPLYQELVSNIITLEASLIAIRAKKQALMRIVNGYNEKLKNFPGKEVELGRLIRDVKIGEDRYTFLIKEREKAGLIKAKKTTENIKIVSLASVPLTPKGRLTKLLLGGIASFFLSIIMVFGLEVKKQILK